MITINTIGAGRHIRVYFPALSQKSENEFRCDVRRVTRSCWMQFNDFARQRIN